MKKLFILILFVTSLLSFSKKELIKIYEKTGSPVAKAMLAKIYFKEKNYKLSEKYIKELLLSKQVPQKVKNELLTYLEAFKEKKGMNIKVSVGLLYDSNLNNKRKKEKRINDMAHIEQACISAYFENEDVYANINAKVQARNYILHNEYNFIYTDIDAELLYFTEYINPAIEIKFEHLTDENALNGEVNIKLERKFSYLIAGIESINGYYKVENMTFKRYGGGIYGEILNKKLKLRGTFSVYKDDTNAIGYDNTNYKSQIDFGWNFTKDDTIDIKYYYVLSDFATYLSHSHHFDFVLTTRESKHFYYSFGTGYYYKSDSLSDDSLVKYTVFAEFIYSF
jgi:hypothetical protein